MNEYVEQLKTARSFIEKGWVQEDYALDNKGESVWGNEPTATCWCTIGALQAAIDSTSTGELEYFLGKAVASVRGLTFNPDIMTGEVINYNDARCRTQEQILRLFDSAIQIAEQA